MTDSKVDPARTEDVAPIFSADVILLEEVEARWGGPLATGFLDMVDRMRERESHLDNR
jgi:endonuclease/exonuclease/phosphatase family metal-dependent hydrolase